MLSIIISTTQTTFASTFNGHTLGIVQWQYDCHPLVFNAGLVRVIDPDMNTDPQVPDKFDIEIVSDYNKNDMQKYVQPIHTAVETGNSTGVFESMVFWGDPHDEGIGHRVPIWHNVTVTAKYTDNTLPSSYQVSEMDVTRSIIVKDVKPIKEKIDGTTLFHYMYEPCTLEILHLKNNPNADVYDVVFPPPLQQLDSGLSLEQIICKDGLVLIQKHDDIPACVKPSTASSLVERGWEMGMTHDKRVAGEGGYLATFMVLQVAEPDQTIALDLQGPSNQVEQIVQDYDISVMSSKVTDDRTFSNIFGNMAHANLKKFFEDNPVNSFVKRGLTMYPLGGFADNTGTYGSFTEFVTEKQGQKMGQVMQHYEERRDNMEQVSWDEIMLLVENLTDDNKQADIPIEKGWTASHYLNHMPLPNGKFEKNIEKVILWNMMDELKNHGIENWKNDPNAGSHTDEGWMNPSKMCSKIFLEGRNEVYVSAEFYSEPELNITGIIIDDSKPTDCQKWFWIPSDTNFENGIMVFKYAD